MSEGNQDHSGWGVGAEYEANGSDNVRCLFSIICHSGEEEPRFKDHRSDQVIVEGKGP